MSSFVTRSKLADDFYEDSILSGFAGSEASSSHQFDSMVGVSFVYT